jgi:hypothetical protein
MADLTTLAQEWDTVSQASQAAAVVLDDPNAAHAKAAQKNAVLLRQGKPLPDVNLVGGAKRIVSAAEVALAQLAQEIVSAVQDEMGGGQPALPEPQAVMTGEQFVQFVRDAFVDKAAAKELGETRFARKREYDRVVEKVNEAKSEHLRRERQADLDAGRAPRDDGTIQRGFTVAGALTEDELKTWKDGRP